jgi:hypothetical protein
MIIMIVIIIVIIIIIITDNHKLTTLPSLHTHPIGRTLRSCSDGL